MGKSASLALFNRDGYLFRCLATTLIFLLCFAVPFQQAKAWAFAIPAFEIVLATAGRAASKRIGSFLVTNGGRVASMSNAASRSMNMKNIGVGLAGASIATGVGDQVGNVVINPSTDSNKNQIYAPIEISLEDGFPRSNPDFRDFNDAYTGSNFDVTPKDKIEPRTNQIIGSGGVSPTGVNLPKYTTIDTGDYFSSDQLFYEEIGPGTSKIYLEMISGSNAYLNEKYAYEHKYAVPGQTDGFTFPDRDQSGRTKGTSINIWEKQQIEGTDHTMDVIVGQYNVYSKVFVESSICPSGYSFSNNSCTLTASEAVAKPDNTPCQIRLVNGSFNLDSRNPNCNPTMSGVTIQVVSGALVIKDTATGRITGVVPATASNPMTIYEQDATGRTQVELGPIDGNTGLRPVVTAPPISKPIENDGLGDYAGSGTTNPPDTGTGEGGGSVGLPTFCAWAEVVCNAINWFQSEDDIPEIEQYEIQEIDQNNLPTNPDISFTRACPPPVSIPIDLGIVSTSIEISYQPFCDFFDKARPFIIAAAYLHGAFIISGFRKET